MVNAIAQPLSVFSAPGSERLSGGLSTSAQIRDSLPAEAQAQLKEIEQTLETIRAGQEDLRRQDLEFLGQRIAQLQEELTGLNALTGGNTAPEQQAVLARAYESLGNRLQNLGAAIGEALAQQAGPVAQVLPESDGEAAVLPTEGAMARFSELVARFTEPFDDPYEIPRPLIDLIRDSLKSHQNTSLSSGVNRVA